MLNKHYDLASLVLPGPIQKILQHFHRQTEHYTIVDGNATHALVRYLSVENLLDITQNGTTLVAGTPSRISFEVFRRSQIQWVAR